MAKQDYSSNIAKNSTPSKETPWEGPVVVPGSQPLDPRASFDIWRESLKAPLNLEKPILDKEAEDIQKDTVALAEERLSLNKEFGDLYYQQPELAAPLQSLTLLKRRRQTYLDKGEAAPKEIEQTFWQQTNELIVKLRTKAEQDSTLKAKIGPMFERHGVLSHKEKLCEQRKEQNNAARTAWDKRNTCIDELVSDLKKNGEYVSKVPPIQGKRSTVEYQKCVDCTRHVQNYINENNEYLPPEVTTGKFYSAIPRMVAQQKAEQKEIEGPVKKERKQSEPVSPRDMSLPLGKKGTEAEKKHSPKKEPREQSSPVTPHGARSPRGVSTSGGNNHPEGTEQKPSPRQNDETDRNYSPDSPKKSTHAEKVEAKQPHSPKAGKYTDALRNLEEKEKARKPTSPRENSAPIGRSNFRQRITSLPNPLGFRGKQ